MCGRESTQWIIAVLLARRLHFFFGFPTSACGCYAATQPALQLYQVHIQVVRSNGEARKCPPKGTPQWTFGLEGIRIGKQTRLEEQPRVCGSLVNVKM